MKSRDYWRKRQEDLQNLIFEPSESYVKEIEKFPSGYSSTRTFPVTKSVFWY